MDSSSEFHRRMLAGAPIASYGSAMPLLSGSPWSRWALCIALLPSAPLSAQRIVRESLAQWQQARPITLTVERRWCIDADADGCDFKSPASVRATPDGGLLASDFMGPLRLFSPGGAFVRSLGRRGQGPGEYGFVVNAHVTSTGLVTWFDNTQMRFASVSMDGTPGPVARVMPPATMAELFTMDTTLVVLDVPAAPVRGTMVTATYHTVPVHGAPRTLATVRTPSSFVPGSDMRPLTAPFAPRVLGSVSDAGDVLHSNGGQYAVEVFPAGGAAWRLEVAAPGRRVLPAERDSALRALLTRMRVKTVADLPPAAREGFDASPSVHPPLSALRVMADGTIWIRPAPEAGATIARWDVFTRQGTRVGRVSLPLRARLWDGRRDWVLVSELDDDDVPHFVRYRVGASR
jgi:hypothetical protein